MKGASIMPLGNKILDLRKKNGLSQEQLGEMIDVTRQTISNWELGETSPNPEQLKRLSKALKVSIDDLLDNDIKNIVIEKVLAFIFRDVRFENLVVKNNNVKFVTFRCEVKIGLFAYVSAVYGKIQHVDRRSTITLCFTCNLLRNDVLHNRKFAARD